MMYMSSKIKNETWNGGNWIEGVSSHFGFYQISLFAGDDCQEHPRHVVVLDDPDYDEKPFMALEKDVELDFTKMCAVSDYIENLYANSREEGYECDYRYKFKVQKTTDGWKLFLKDEELGVYSSFTSAITNADRRIYLNWHNCTGKDKE